MYRIILLIIVFAHGLPAYADPGGFRFELGEEYSEYNRTSPNSPSNASKIRTPKSKASFWRRAGLYLPNRFLDLIDIFKVDIGAGVGYGGMIRPTKYLQAGYREFEPGMLRVGLMGRRAPVLIEERKLAGFGSEYGRNSSRKVSPGEFGLGIDAGIVGVYGGISLDSTADFILGIFGVDFEDDDLK